MRTTIAEQTNALLKTIADNRPAGAPYILGDERATLSSTARADDIVIVGTSMPDGISSTHMADPRRATAFEGAAPSSCSTRRMVSFRNVALRSYQSDLLPELAARGIVLIAVSTQTPDVTLTMEETNQLSCPVISDPGNQIAGQLGIVTEPSEQVRDLHAAVGLDVAAGNADGTYDIPVPAVLIVDAEGIIRWAGVCAGYTTRTAPSAILDALDAQAAEALKWPPIHRHSDPP